MGYTELPESLFFGVLEVVSFLFLFLSPWLSELSVSQGWYGLALWRSFAVGLLLAYGGLGGRARLALLGRGLLYSLPLWLSSLSFTLRSDQTSIMTAVLLSYLVLQAVLALISFLGTDWMGGFVCLVSLLYLQHFKPGPWPLFLLVGTLLLFWPRRFVSRVESLRLPSLVAPALWCVALWLKVEVGEPALPALANALLFWLVLSVAGGIVLTRSRADDWTRSLEKEVELGLPDLSRALAWLYSRELLYGSGCWFLVLILTTRGSQDLALLGVTLAALPGLVGLAARGAREGSLAWWCCWQFVLLWLAAQASPLEGVVLILLSGLWSGYYWSTRVEREGPDIVEASRPASAQLERRLAQALAVQCPPGFAKELLAQVEPSVDIDNSLTSSAPTGFRERLLARLRKDEQDPSDE